MSDDSPRSSAREVWLDAAGHSVKLRLQKGRRNLALGHKTKTSWVLLGPLRMSCWEPGAVVARPRVFDSCLDQ